jgi:hypothetical protein
VSTAIVVAAVLLAFLIACPCGIGAILAGRSFVADSRTEYTKWIESSHRVAWSGEGRYGVAQVVGADGTPGVVAWDRQTGNASSIAGYRLAAVEHYGAVAWLVPVSEGELTERLDGEWGAVLVPAGGAFDSVPGSLLAWGLGADEPAAVPPREPAWVRWPGPGQWSATAEVDPSRGAYPSRIAVGTSRTPTDDRVVSLPAGVATFDVIGWSHSGRYLALAEMIPSDGEDAEGTFARRLFVIDASEARVVSTAFQKVTAASGPSPVWDESRDLLLWVDADDRAPNGSSPSSLEPVVMTLEPGGSPRPAGETLTIGDAADVEDVRGTAVHRSGPEGVLLDSAGVLVRWSVGEGRVVVSGAVPDATSPPVYHRNGGLLVLAEEHDAEGPLSRDVLVHLERETGEWAVAWTGEWRTEE